MSFPESSILGLPSDGSALLFTSQPGPGGSPGASPSGWGGEMRAGCVPQSVASIAASAHYLTHSPSLGDSDLGDPGSW